MRFKREIFIGTVLAVMLSALSACTGASDGASSAVGGDSSQASASAVASEALPVSDISISSEDPTDPAGQEALSSEPSSESADVSVEADPRAQAKKLFKELGIEKDMREEFVHGEKGPEYQKYIVLHDTEGDGEAQGVIEYWDSSDEGVAAHFVVNKNGSIMQCVPLDKIAHHAGFGDTGHNEKYGVEDESRDDKVGTSEIGDWASDYGMNSYSIGIEMVHVGGEDDYPEEQLEAVDGLIAYIDAYYGKESVIIDHKAWRTGNSDTSEEFAEYLENYQDHRTHLDAAE